MIGQFISHYRILEKLGEGGMGVVYKAHDTKLDRDVALKFLPHHLTATTDEQARFLQEARAASALNHPNVCTIYDIAEHDGQQFIVMECIDGKTLRQMVPVQKMQIAIDYAIQIGEALQEAHGKGIVHRDVKADNIMVNSKNQIKVMDFGLAKLKGSLKLTKTSSTVGTLAYMAPEQIQGGEVDARSDLFSFGVVLYEMLTGHMPFRGEHEAAVMYSIVNEEALPLDKYLPDVSSELVHVLNRALEKDPEERYQSVHDMVIDLRRLKKETSKIIRSATAGMEGKGFDRTGIEVESTVSRRVPLKKSVWIISGIGLGAVLLATIVLMLWPGGLLVNSNASTRVVQISFPQLGYPSISADGNWIVFPAADLSGKWDVYQIHVTGGEVRRLTNDSSRSIVTVDLSPDGSQVVYDRTNPLKRIQQICVVGGSGGISRVVADTGISSAWRRDGRRIAYIKSNHSYCPSRSGMHEYWTVGPDGRDNRLEFIDMLGIGKGSEVGVCWSPDGGSLAYLRTFPDGTGEVVKHDLSTGKEIQLTSLEEKMTDLYWTKQNYILFSSTKHGAVNIWMVSANGGEPAQVTRGPGPDYFATMSADGNKLLYYQRQDISHLWVANLDGSGIHQVTSGEALRGWPSFSPDGSQIVFSMASAEPNLNPEAHLFIMERDGTNLRQLTAGNEFASSSRYSPDGTHVAYRCRGVQEPADSNNLHVIDLKNPGVDKVLGKATSYWAWIDDRSLCTYWKGTTWVYYLDGQGPSRFFLDSTFALPRFGKKYVQFLDFRKATQGVWLVPFDEAQDPLAMKPRKLLSSPIPWGASSDDGRFLCYLDGKDEIWKMILPQGTTVRLRNVFQGLRASSTASLGLDGEQIVYSAYQRIGKYVLIEQPFR